MADRRLEPKAGEEYGIVSSASDRGSYRWRDLRNVAHDDHQRTVHRSVIPRRIQLGGLTGILNRSPGATTGTEEQAANYRGRHDRCAFWHFQIC